jgi:NADH:ubiquinone oxidoreductase subunit F (NADH-binding)
MRGEIGFKLMQAGECCNPMCRRPLYAELMRFPDDEACDECVPPREGLPTAFRLLMESGEMDQRDNDLLF